MSSRPRSRRGSPTKMELGWAALSGTQRLLELCSRLLETDRAISEPNGWFRCRWIGLRRRRLCTRNMSVGKGESRYDISGEKARDGEGRPKDAPAAFGPVPSKFTHDLHRAPGTYCHAQVDSDHHVRLLFLFSSLHLRGCHSLVQPRAAVLTIRLSSSVL